MKPEWPESWPLMLVAAAVFAALMLAARAIEQDAERAELERAESVLRVN